MIRGGKYKVGGGEVVVQKLLGWWIYIDGYFGFFYQKNVFVVFF